MFGLLLGALVCAKTVQLANDYAITAQVRREGHEHFQRCEASVRARMREEAAAKDAFFRPELGMAFPDYSFWSDGSVKIDKYTRREYPKGQFYYDSLGYPACGLFQPPHNGRVPK